MKAYPWLLPLCQRLGLLTLSMALAFGIDYYLLLIPVPDLPQRFLTFGAFAALIILCCTFDLFHVQKRLDIATMIELYLDGLLAVSFEADPDEMRWACQKLASYQRRIEQIKPATDKTSDLVSLLITMQEELTHAIAIYQPY